MNEERDTEIDVETEDREIDVQTPAVEDSLLLGVSELLSKLLAEVRAMRAELRERPRMTHPARPDEVTKEKIKITEI